MSTTQIEPRPTEPGPDQTPTGQVEISRNAGLAALVGVAAAGIGIAYLSRAVDSGALLDWALAVAMSLVGAAFLRTFVDARTPLLVADPQGIRIRLGRTWRGMPWTDLEQVEVRERTSRWGDGRIVLHPVGLDDLIDELDPRGRRQAALAARLTGAPLGLPLGLTTRVSGAPDGLAAALRGLAGRQADVVVDEAVEPVEPEAVEPEAVEPEEDSPTVLRDPRPGLAHAISLVAERLTLRRPHSEDEQEEDESLVVACDSSDDTAVRPAVTASVTPEPSRPLRSGRRAEVVHEREPVEQIAPLPTEVAHDDRLDTEVVILDDLAHPAEDPVIGPQVAAARKRLRLTVDTLAERTRIRPHVIESIEVDDFGPCGGDFYARGHLRTLCRVLGIDVTPLIAEYDERYASGPIDPRRVFAAEFAGGPNAPLRSTSGAPRWSLLVGVAMALVLIWSIARLATDDSDLDRAPAVLTGVQGERAQQGNSGNSGNQGNQGSSNRTKPTPLRLTATADTDVQVVDGGGKTLWEGTLAAGEFKQLPLRQAVDVTASDAGAVTAKFGGADRGVLGGAGLEATVHFAPPER